jgi:hypothetical protein
MILRFSINKDSINQKINKALSTNNAVKIKTYNLANSYFKRAKNIMLKNFNSNPITMELEGGANNQENISGTLDGYGNLYSFIGFYKGEKPTESLRQILDDLTYIKPTIFRNKKFYFKISIPSREEIENVTQMPWENGNSWAYEVEGEISGLSNFLYKEWLGSRSSMGMQLNHKYIESISFHGRPYITEILNNFREAISKQD